MLPAYYSWMKQFTIILLVTIGLLVSYMSPLARPPVARSWETPEHLQYRRLT